VTCNKPSISSCSGVGFEPVAQTNLPFSMAQQLKNKQLGQ